jgi:preprotein translocase subunit SecB
MAAKKKTAAPKKPAAAPAADGGNGGGAQPADQPQGQMAILVQFIKDLSFESPNSPKSLQGPGENPQLNVNVNVQATPQGEGIYEVDLNFEAKATSDDGVIYNVELVYAGLFRLEGIPEQFLQPVLFVDCPTLLFPFARRIMADLTQEGAFPPLLLDPVDFAGLYQQNAAQIQQQAPGA